MTCPPWIVVNTYGECECDTRLAYLLQCHYREVGIGCKISPGTTKQMDNNRSAIIKLLITCFSEALYYSPAGKVTPAENMA